jgi:1-acyl-sn-glycerol-3-phosphate acyltransferase
LECSLGGLAVVTRYWQWRVSYRGKETMKSRFGSLPESARGSSSLLVLAVNTVFWSLLLFVVAVLKHPLPMDRWRLACDRLLNAIGQCWVGCNKLGLHYTKNIHWEVTGTEALRPDRWYLVVANHQSWVDIVVLQCIFHRRAPMLKFFLKRELFWIPVLGIAWWAMGFPFMRRSSSVHKDFETTRKACEGFKSVPTSIMNFVEGTRFTPEKRQQQHSPFKNLLKPKAAGVALVLETMGNQLHSIVDVTIVYPEGVREIWAFLCSRSVRIKVQVKELPITDDLLGDYLADRQLRRHFNNWLNALWSEKDQTIETLRQP